jgi:hypothetical protein
VTAEVTDNVGGEVVEFPDRCGRRDLVHHPLRRASTVRDHRPVLATLAP